MSARYIRCQKWDPQIIPKEETWRGVGPNSTALHFENFRRAVKERKQPVEDALAGHRAAAVAHMINLSAEKKAPVYWDLSKETMTTDRKP